MIYGFHFNHQWFKCCGWWLCYPIFTHFMHAYLLITSHCHCQELLIEISAALISWSYRSRGTATHHHCWTKQLAALFQNLVLSLAFSQNPPNPNIRSTRFIISSASSFSLITTTRHVLMRGFILLPLRTAASRSQNFPVESKCQRLSDKT